MALDPVYFFYSDGTITLTNGSDIATGQFTSWDPAVLPFDFVFPNDGTSGMSVVKEVLAADQIQLAKPWTGPTLTNVPYFMLRWANHIDPRIYGVRVSDYLTRVKAPEVTLPQLQALIDDAVEIQVSVTASATNATTAAADADAAKQASNDWAEVSHQWSIDAVAAAQAASTSETNAAFYAGVLATEIYDFGTLADAASGEDDWGTL